MINPLDLYGPQFLVFYAVVCGLVLLAFWAVTKTNEARTRMPKLNLTDPYEIAFLRGGEKEAFSVATFSLADRKLLNISGDVFSIKDMSSIAKVQRPIEKEILKKFSLPRTTREIFVDMELMKACEGYQSSLEKLNLMANGKIYSQRLPIFLIGLSIILCLAGAKIYVALERGRSNIEFLCLCALAFSVLLHKVYKRRRTGLGDQAIADLKVLFDRLKKRRKFIRAGGETNEAALLAAVFGVTTLSATQFPYIKKLTPSTPKNSSGCGTSCSGGCGGGGCGGGCGGCGS